METAASFGLRVVHTAHCHSPGSVRPRNVRMPFSGTPSVSCLSFAGGNVQPADAFAFMPPPTAGTQIVCPALKSSSPLFCHTSDTSTFLPDASAGRTLDDLWLVHKLFISIGEEQLDVGGGRKLGTGSVETVTDDIKRFQDYGYRSGWAVGSLQMAEKILQAELGIPKPAWLDDDWDEKNVVALP